jgi:hypothetical protein
MQFGVTVVGHQISKEDTDRKLHFKEKGEEDFLLF